MPPNVPRTLGAYVSNSGSDIVFSTRDNYNTLVHPARSLSGEWILATYPEYHKDTSYAEDYIVYDNGIYYRRKVAGTAGTAMLVDDDLENNWSLLGSYSRSSAQ